MSAQSNVVTPASAKAAMSARVSASSTAAPWPSASCQPPFTIREIEYPGASSARTRIRRFAFLRPRARGTHRSRKRRRGDVRVIEDGAADPMDAESTAAERIRTRDHRVRGHPVVGMRLALLGGEQRKERRERVERKGLPRRQRKVLAAQLERIAELVIANHPDARRLFNDHAQIEETERRARATLAERALLHSPSIARP